MARTVSNLGIGKNRNKNVYNSIDKIVRGKDKGKTKSGSKMSNKEVFKFLSGK